LKNHQECLQQMEIFDNTTKILKDDLMNTLRTGSKVSIAAACFSIYAFDRLKNALSAIDSMRFIFTSPSFLTEKEMKEKREFYIPRLNRERSLYGSEFEIKLRNELMQKSIAKECADWIRNKVQFRSNVTQERMNGFINIEQSESDPLTYAPIDGFSTTDLGFERGDAVYNMVMKLDAPQSREYVRLFDNIWTDTTRLEDVTEEIIESINEAYAENSPEFIYIITLFTIFNEFLDDISEDVLPNEATGFKDSQIWGKLYDFQRDAALAIINKLEQFNGCILADSVGLGKTFTALAVIKYYENRNKSVLVLCPKKLSENWMTFKCNYVNNPVIKDRLRYDVLYHTDLSRTEGMSNGIDLERLNWGNYDLVVIDESHNFRNGADIRSTDEGDTRENRYLRLLNTVIRSGVRTKVLMLSATPVNNRFLDLKNQLALAYEGDANQWRGKLNIHRPIDEVFKNAQKAFTAWSKLDYTQRTTDALLQDLDFDFFEILDSVTISRSRKHIEKYYRSEDIGKFPDRLPPLSVREPLTRLPGTITYAEINTALCLLNLEVYSPSLYIFPSKQEKYGAKIKNLSQAGREQGIRRLMAINLLKRLESSVHSFLLTLERVQAFIADTIKDIDRFEKNRDAVFEVNDFDTLDDFDLDDQNTDILATRRKTKISLKDMDYKTWRSQLESDLFAIADLKKRVSLITSEHDAKLQALFSLIDNKQQAPINPGNRKLLIFTAFADTADYLYQHVSQYALQRHGIHTGIVTGTTEGRTTLPKFKASMNNVLTCFSPLSKDKANLMPSYTGVLDILIATDCISEGQNLQDCDYVVNYDIHWNPVRIIQRFGRVDRIGSRNEKIQMVNFWPDIDLDEYINLKSRVETRMKISVLSASGDDDLLNAEEKGDLEYRKRQLERLHSEVVDIEEMGNGLSIMDLGLNEFRLDLLEYVKTHPDLDTVPYGMSAVVAATEDTPAGVFFVLRNLNSDVNVGSRNRLHPFYLIYIGMDGEVICDHLAPKHLLDTLRLLCKGRNQPDLSLCRAFNKDCRDGKDMRLYSDLLGKAIANMVETKDESDIDSLFKAGGTSALVNKLGGLNDFELICFLVVRPLEAQKSC
jgi:hypothetical protein